MNEAEALLVAMGFEMDQVQEAMRICDGNADHAVEYLLSGMGQGPDAGATATDTTTGSLIVGPISQYSMEDGCSACTCIALTAATLFLSDPTSISPTILEHMVRTGVSTYQQLARVNDMEHMSAEEVLSQSTAFPVKLLPQGIQQGVLSKETNHPLGLQSMLQGCERLAEQWTVVIITKTPETVLVCLPPTSYSTELEIFWLIDSHPRPQLQTENAYAKSHSTIMDLCLSLQLIFPLTDLGADIPEMVSTMYNSFDLYLVGKSNPST